MRDNILSNVNAIIDVHTHCGHEVGNVLSRRYPTSQSVIDLEYKTRLSGIDYVVSFPCPGSTFYFGTDKHTPLKNPLEDFPYFFANRQIFYEISMFGENRIMPFGMVYPQHEEQKQVDYLEQIANKNILYGLKLHTLATGYSALTLLNSPIIELAKHYSLPILIHTGTDETSNPMHVIELAKKNPDINFCMAHAAHFQSDVLRFLSTENISNIFLDTSPFLALCKIAAMEPKSVNTDSLPFSEPVLALKYFCQKYPNHILWGTDEPWTALVRNGKLILKAIYQDEVDLLKTLPEDLLKKVAHYNTSRFLFKD